MNDGDQTVLPFNRSNELTEQIWSFDESSTDEDRAAVDLAAGALTSVGYIRAALRRSRWLWCVSAVAGMLIGFGAYKAFPPAYQASTTILLSSNLPGPPGQAIQDDAAIVQSRTIAAAALKRLGLRQSPASFTGDYTAVPLTYRVLSITTKATSSDAAVKEANALATAFLTFQERLLNQGDQGVNVLLEHEIARAQLHVHSINAEISQLSAQPATPAQKAKIGSLSAERNKAVNALGALKQAVQSNDATTKVENATLVKDSRVLDPAAPLPQHAKRYLLLYVGGGLIAGLALGLFIVIVRALVSDRLRRRDDVARTLGAPVKLSVGKVRYSRWRPGRRGLEAAEDADIRRIVMHLERQVPPSWGGLASLAVVPVDDMDVPAICLASLAIVCAQQGFQVVVADLCAGFPAARLLGATESGLQRVSVHGANLVVAVPDPDDVAPVGPLGRQSRRAQSAGSLADACASADLLFTLVNLDPSLGSEYLASWARGAIAMVTAGQSTVERVHAVGEMIRLAGTDLISAVLVGADKSDQSLGTTPLTSPTVSVSPDLR